MFVKKGFWLGFSSMLQSSEGHQNKSILFFKINSFSKVKLSITDDIVNLIFLHSDTDWSSCETPAAPSGIITVVSICRS